MRQPKQQCLLHVVTLALSSFLGAIQKVAKPRSIDSDQTQFPIWLSKIADMKCREPTAKHMRKHSWCMCSMMLPMTGTSKLQQSGIVHCMQFLYSVLRRIQIHQCIQNSAILSFYCCAEQAAEDSVGASSYIINSTMRNL